MKIFLLNLTSEFRISSRSEHINKMQTEVRQSDIPTKWNKQWGKFKYNWVSFPQNVTQIMFLLEKTIKTLK